MRQLYYLLLLMVVLAVPAGALADKTVYLTTDNAAATSVVVTEGYNATRYDWNADGRMTLQLGDRTGFNLVVAGGYSVSSVAVDGTQITGSVTSSYYVEPKYLADGCTVEVKTVAREKKRVLLSGDPSRIMVSYLYRLYSESDWTGNTLAIDIQDNTSTVQISAMDGYGLSGVWYNGNNELEAGARTFQIYPSVLHGGDNTFTVESYSLADVRTSTFRVNVDGDPAEVIVCRAGDNTEFTGVALSAPIPFSPEIDLPVTIRSNRFERSFYEVRAAGEPVDPVAGVYTIRSLADGETVDVKVDYPDLDIPVRFHFVNENTDGAVARVCDSNYTIIDREKWLDPGFTVKMGSIVRIDLDNTNYTVTGSLDGVETSSTNITFTALDADGYDITVDAEPREPFEVTFYYEGLPSHFTVVCGADYRIEMTGKEMTKASVPRNLNRLRVVPDEGWLVAGVYVDGVESSPDFVVSGNVSVDVYMEEYSRDENLVVYFRPGASWDFRSLTLCPDDAVRASVVYPADGYTLVKFNPGDLPALFDLMLGGSHDYISYIDGVRTAEPLVTLNEASDGTIVKFFASEPETYDVTFDIAADADVSVVRDLVADMGRPVVESLLAGTEIMIVPAGSAEVTVSADGTDIVADADRRFRLTVDAPMSVKVDSGTLSGVSASYCRERQDVYSSQGILLINDASAEEMAGLAAGIYIVAGKKMIIK